MSPNLLYCAKCSLHAGRIQFTVLKDYFIII